MRARHASGFSLTLPALPALVVLPVLVVLTGVVAVPTSALAQDKTEPANEVDHIIPHQASYHLMWDRENWQALCKSCHSKKTASERNGLGEEW